MGQCTAFVRIVLVKITSRYSYNTLGKVYFRVLHFRPLILTFLDGKGARKIRKFLTSTLEICGRNMLSTMSISVVGKITHKIHLKPAQCANFEFKAAKMTKKGSFVICIWLPQI
jgi:hypothetical protein